jgi:hypothetical protein
MSAPCEHPRVTEYLHRYPATQYEPEEIVGRAVCDECGEALDLEDVPEGASETVVWQ